MWLFLTFACTPTEPVDPTDSTPLAPTPPPATLPLPAWSCPTEPPVFTLGPLLDAPRANRSLAFMEDRLIGWDAPSLIEATSETEAGIWVPTITAYGGMVPLQDGRMASSQHLGEERVQIVNPDGSSVAISPAIRAYGMVGGPDGMLYATSEYDAIWRIDPVTETATEWLALEGDLMPRLAEFSPDGSRLYLGTRAPDGPIYVIEIDDQMEPIGQPTLFANTSSWFHDILVVDACGNLLVTGFHGAGLHWIEPDGTVHDLAALTDEEHIHGAAWGSGMGPWDPLTLYLAHPNIGNRVTAWPYGVPSRVHAP